MSILVSDHCEQLSPRIYLLLDAPEGEHGPRAALVVHATGRGWHGPLTRRLFPSVAAAIAAKVKMEAGR